MWAYTPPPYTHVVLTTVRKKGRGWANRTKGKECHFFALFCKQVGSGNGIVWNRCRNVAETPEASVKQKAHKGNKHKEGEHGGIAWNTKASSEKRDMIYFTGGSAVWVVFSYNPSAFTWIQWYFLVLVSVTVLIMSMPSPYMKPVPFALLRIIETSQKKCSFAKWCYLPQRFSIRYMMNQALRFVVLIPGLSKFARSWRNFYQLLFIFCYERRFDVLP